MLFLSLIALFTFVGRLISQYSRIPQVAVLVFIGLGVRYIFGDDVVSNDTLHLYMSVVVALMLFLAGIRFSPLLLRSVERTVLLNGIFQIFLSSVVLFPVLLFFDFIVFEAIVLSLLFSFSSWIFIEQIFEKRGLFSVSAGKHLYHFLFAQTLLVIPVVFFIPLLLEGNLSVGGLISSFFSVVSAIILFSLLFFVQRLLYSKIISRLSIPSVEMHTLYIFLFATVSMWLFAQLGVSYMFSAFFVGMLFSEQVKHLPFLSSSSSIRDFILSIFFILLGILLEVGLVFTMIPMLIVLTLAIVFIKFLSVLLVLRNTSFLLFPAVLLSSSMVGIGEISFAVAFFAFQETLFSASVFQLFLLLFILSFISVSYSHVYFVKLFEWGCGRGYLGARGKAEFTAHNVSLQEQEMHGHVIICGFGKAGCEVQNLIDAADTPYVVIDTDLGAHSVTNKKNKTFFPGDPTDREILYSAGVARAKTLVVLVRDISSQEKIIRYALSQNPQITIICRSEGEEYRYRLLNLGANTIVAPEFEVGIRIGQAVLYANGVKNENITAMIKKIRKQYFID